jgi:hypothetical protein
MSSPGQIIGGVVGAVAGFFLSSFNPVGALYGAQLGMMAGGAIDPPQGPTVEGPRLSDLTVQTSNYGASIPRVYGTAVLNGNVIWLEGNRLKESVTKTKSGGKGGSKSKTTTRNYSYSATFAVGLCQGPIAGVRRIWIGPKLIYHAGATDPETIVASNEATQGFALYLGTHTQQPDPRIQADVGVANAPAWRGLAYLVFYDLELASYGNSLAGAQVRVEVIQPTATEAIAITTNTAPSVSRTMEMAWIGESITGIGFEVVSSQYYIERLVATPSTAEVAMSTTLLPGYGAGKIPHTVRGNPALLVALTAYAGSSLAFFDDQGDEVGTRIRMDSPFTSLGRRRIADRLERVQRPDDDARIPRRRRFSLRFCQHRFGRLGGADHLCRGADQVQFDLRVRRRPDICQGARRSAVSHRRGLQRPGRAMDLPDHAHFPGQKRIPLLLLQRRTKHDLRTHLRWIDL